MGTLFLRGAGFKHAFQGFFRCRNCGALLIQEKNDSGLPKFESPFWIAYTLFLAGMLAIIWGVFAYLESNIGNENPWLLVPALIVIFVALFIIMDKIRARYWMLKETSFEEHMEEIKSQRMSTSGVVAFLLFGIAALTCFILLNNYAQSLELSATNYALSAIGYMIIVILLAFRIMKYLSGNASPESD